jgi:hypothetical protein
MHSKTLVSVIAGALVAFAPAIVSAEGLAPELPTVQGTYSISAFKKSNDKYDFAGCVVMAGGNVPTLRNGGDPSCRQAPDATTEHRWNLYKVRSGHVIKSPVNGGCLIRGNNGMDRNPSLYLWQQNADKTYCGFADGRALRDNGQAYWYLDVLEYGTEASLVGFAGDVVLPYLQSGLAIDGNGQLVFSDRPGDWTFHFNTLAP